MSYTTNDLPETQLQWDALWQQIQIENQLKTDRESYEFLTQMVLGVTGTIAELNDGDKDYTSWRLFVNFIFDEWLIYDNLLNEFND